VHKRRTRKAPAILTGVVLVGLLATGTYAFTNTNTVPISDSGQGANTISGYTISDVTYNESATNPHKLADVVFTLAPKDGGGAPTSVSASLVDVADGVGGATGQNWYACSLNAATVLVTNDWSCATGSSDLDYLDMSAATELDIVAHD
jgi:hypothetical protein